MKKKTIRYCFLCPKCKKLFYVSVPPDKRDNIKFKDNLKK